MKRTLLSTGLSVALSLLALSARGQMSFGGTPASWGQSERSLGAAPTLEAPPQDNQRLLERADRSPLSKGVQFGEPVVLAATAKTSGSWSTLPDGTRLWRLRLRSAGAEHLSVYFRRFRLPKGATLYVYSDDHSELHGAVTAVSNQPDGQLYLAPLAAEAITLELAVSAELAPQLELELGHVVHGFRPLPLADRSLRSFGLAASCHLDAACTLPSNHPNPRRSVGVILSSGGAGCTGAMINNTAQDGRPLFLTADHCFSVGEALGTYAVLFNYDREGCGTGAQGTTTMGLSGATLLARTRTDALQQDPFETDFLLFELGQRPPPSYNVFYAGWNRATTVTGLTSTYGFSHPCGDVKKFSYSSTLLRLTGLVPGTADEIAGNTYFAVDWDGSTATEPGSSGSPLFDASGRIIGQLFGGNSYCAGPSPCRVDGQTDYIAGPDWYGVIGQSWNGPTGSTASTRLRDHLDPGSVNVSTLDGANTPNPAPEGYCYSGAESTDDTRINRVRLGTIDQSSTASGCVRYTNFRNVSTTLTAGQSYTLTLTRGTCGSNFSFVAKAFVDWNADRDFDDAGELVYNSNLQTASSSSTDVSGMFTVPAGVVNGTSTVMRVVVRERVSGEMAPAAVSATQACGVYPWGETEDYTINLVNSTTAIEDQNAGYNDPNLEVYPNPAAAPVTIRWRVAEPSGAPALLSIIDASGASAYAGALPYDAGEGRYATSLPSGTLAPGSYLVRVAVGDRQAARRLVVVQ